MPATAILGEVDRGFAVLMGELQRERLTLAIGAVAAAEGLLADTVEYVKERKAFGCPAGVLQNTRFKLAEAATDVRVHRAFVDECKALFMAGELDVPTVSMAKVACTEMQGAWRIPACSYTAVTATCGSMAYPGPMSMPGCNASTAAPAKS